jgi:two-component system, cell cycle sensor histidine kinase and response regulator CckA
VASGMSIRSQLRLLALGVALPITSLAAFAIVTEFRTSLRVAEAEADQVAATVAVGATQYLADASAIGVALAASPDVRSLDPDRCLRALRPIAAVTPQFTNLLVNRADGRLVCSVVPPPDERGLDASDRPWFMKAVTIGEITVSPPIYGRISQAWISALTFPIEVDGEIIGGVTVPLSLDQLQSLVTREVPENYLLTITDSAVVVLARSDSIDAWIGNRIPSAPGEATDLTVRAGLNRAHDAGGVERIFAFRAIEGAPWIAWAGIPADVVYGPVLRRLYPTVGLAALAILVAALLGLIVHRRIGGSLTGLITGMEAAEATPGGSVPETGPPEVARVASQYNRLLRARREAEAEAAASADLHELVMRATNDGVWDWDLTRDRVDANPRFFELFGGGPSDSGGGEDFWRSRIHPDDVDAFLARAADESVDSWSAEYRIRRGDGGWAEVLDRVHTLRDADGRRVRLIGASMNVTEQRKAQRAVEKARERYRSILQNAAFGIYVASPDGTVLESNPALRAMLGLGEDEAEAEGLNERDFYAHAEDRDSEVEAALAGQLAGPVEVEWKKATGDLLFVRLFRSTFTTLGGETSLEVMAEDLTERRQLEEQFRQAQKMDAVGRLAGGVAHDFNNRLTVIRGRAQLLKDDMSLDAYALENIDAILESSAGAAKLTKELLAVSRRQVFRPRVVALDDLVGKLKPMLDTLLGETVTLDFRAEDDLPSVSADPGQIEQIVMNLAVNSRDALPDGGRIGIELLRREVGEDEAHSQAGLSPGDYVALRVSDDGIGMDQEVLDRVFEPFFTTKPMGKGTGLGLATVYGLAKQNDGYVSIRSMVGKGTDVELLLPAIEAAPDAPDPVAEKPAGPSTATTVLVVEDEEGVRVIVSRTLKRLGYEVLEAEDAEGALQIAEARLDGIEILVTDVVMPGMNGPALADTLTGRKSDLKVLFISGYADRQPMQLDPDHPNRAFLPKPFTPQSLGRAVADLLA